jgi:hypothetical protein
VAFAVIRAPVVLPPPYPRSELTAPLPLPRHPRACRSHEPHLCGIKLSPPRGSPLLVQSPVSPSAPASWDLDQRDLIALGLRCDTVVRHRQASHPTAALALFRAPGETRKLIRNRPLD